MFHLNWKLDQPFVVHKVTRAPVIMYLMVNSRHFLNLPMNSVLKPQPPDFGRPKHLNLI